MAGDVCQEGAGRAGKRLNYLGPRGVVGVRISGVLLVRWHNTMRAEVRRGRSPGGGHRQSRVGVALGLVACLVMAPAWVLPLGLPLGPVQPPVQELGLPPVVILGLPMELPLRRPWPRLLLRPLLLRPLLLLRPRL